MSSENTATAYLVGFLDRETGEYQGCGIFSEPGPTISGVPFYFTIAESRVVGSYGDAEAKLRETIATEEFHSRNPFVAPTLDPHITGAEFERQVRGSLTDVCRDLTITSTIETTKFGRAERYTDRHADFSVGEAVFRLTRTGRKYSAARWTLRAGLDRASMERSMGFRGRDIAETFAALDRTARMLLSERMGVSGESEREA